jgi:3-hydroxyisobutyrate dehydrogenase
MITATSQRVGMIGLGRMGLAICRRLTAAGFAVVATDVADARRADARDAGAAWADGAATVAARADVVITVLPGPADVVAVIEDVTGGMSPGSIWIDMSTASPPVARRTAAAAAVRGVRVLDAPVSGDPAAAADGRLVSFVGAHADDLEAVRDVLAALAGRIVHVGGRGSGYAVKLLANSLWFGQAVATAEALTLARRAGLDLDLVRDALGASAAAGRFLTDDVPALLAGDDLASFALARCCEQLESVLAFGDELAVPLELTAAVSDVHRAALARYGPVDGELLGARFVAERAGVSFGPGVTGPPSA